MLVPLPLLVPLVLSPETPDNGRVELVESWPIETDLDHPDIPDAHEVWLEMIDGAEHSLEFGEFYCSNKSGSRLEPIVKAIERAAERGVHVRWLAEEKFYKTYPETLDRIDAKEGIEVRRFDVSQSMGGVLHAKYFLVDEREAFIGSQNFDWRALEHIQELGVRVISRELVAPLRTMFDQDWTLAEGGEPDYSAFPHRAAAPAKDSHDDFAVTTLVKEGSCEVELALSPKSWVLPHTWDLPEILERIDDAEHTVRIQLLTYKTKARDGSHFGDLDDALRAAAKRGVKVELLIADWSKRESSLKALKSLQRVDGIDVRFVCVPAWSGGHVPYGRVVHAKYMVVDGERTWIGTSNWERGYFHQSRNMGLVIDGAPFAKQLERFFATGWTSDYAEPLDPDAEYTPPRIGD